MKRRDWSSREAEMVYIHSRLVYYAVSWLALSGVLGSVDIKTLTYSKREVNVKVRVKGNCEKG